LVGRLPRFYYQSENLTLFSRNCLKNGASCGYLAPAEDISDPSLDWSVNPTILVGSSTAATAAMATPSHALPSERFMEPLLGSAVPGSEVLSWYSNMRPPSFSTILPAARSDPFNTLPVELSQESKMLLDHCE
jgi:hypothetical protein